MQRSEKAVGNTITFSSGTIGALASLTSSVVDKGDAFQSLENIMIALTFNAAAANGATVEIFPVAILPDGTFLTATYPSVTASIRKVNNAQAFSLIANVSFQRFVVKITNDDAAQSITLMTASYSRAY